MERPQSDQVIVILRVKLVPINIFSKINLTSLMKRIYWLIIEIKKGKV